ncbi:MAG: histidinol-phosphate transaminase [Chloroflexota bacterium]
MLQKPLPTFPRLQTRLTDEDVKQQYGVTAVHRMNANESPLGPSPSVVAAVQAAASRLGLYPTMGDESLREGLAEVWGQGLTANHFFTGCSGYEAFELTMRAYVAAGDEVIICHPTFGIYDKLTKLQGGIPVQVPRLLPNFELDIEGILTAVTDKTKAVIICNPNNPTGNITSATDMERLVRGLPEHVLLISDEVYIHFVRDAAFPNSVPYVLKERPIVLIHSFSKSYGLAGMRLGYGIAPPDIANYIAGLQRGFHQNHIALTAGVAALADQEHLQKNVQVALDGKAWLFEQLDRLDIAYWPSETNFFVAKMPIDPDTVVERLLAYGVMIRAPQGPGLDSCVRISVGTPEGNAALVQGLEEILRNP